MNEYLTPMTDVILAKNGTIDKYMGDAIMAFWNAPLDDPGHGRNACLTALAMREELARFNMERVINREGEGAYRPVRFGIGLNTGICSVGNLGSIRRFDYSAIGDPVNVAARLESLTKFYGLEMLISEDTQHEATDLAWLEIDIVQLKGRANPTKIFTLVGDEQTAASEEFRKTNKAHKSMIEDYRSGNFHSASAAAFALAKSNVLLASFYSRFASLIDEAARMPPDLWTPIRNMTEK